MSIDWITVAAQIANFLVLVWLLKRFLYRPILDGIDARETEIVNRMKEAVHAKEQAHAVEESYQEKVQALNLAQSEMTETIRKSAEEQRDVLVVEAQQRLEREHLTWKAHLESETQKYTAKMHRAGAGALLSLTRKALCDLADETLEARMAKHLAREIKPMVPDVKRAAGEAVEAVVTSQGLLADSVQEEVTSELRDVFPQIAVRFEADKAQTPGLVLRVGGAELAWTVASYIDGLDALIEEELATGNELKVAPHEQ
ncbi:F0F1 ATP synthase subunit B family protein [Sulfitobacter sp.]|uniref:F0F1 ATP synthase subunit B family protein n=1 Tax=Sulfitobacter sp. TaxID=1903071 RepID=UPI003EF9E162